MRSRLPSKMPQPTTTLKRQNDKSSSEPAPKRKTLVERAGETTSALARTSSLRKPAVQGSSLVDVSTVSSYLRTSIDTSQMKGNLSHARNTSHSSSVSSRTPSVPSRNTSASSFSKSVGPGRSNSALGSRPPSFSQSTTTRPNTSQSKGRSHTSKDSTSSDDDGMPPPGGRRKHKLPVPLGTPSYHSYQDPGLEVVKVRGHRSTESMRSLYSQENSRDLSVSTALSRLNINDDETNPSVGHNLNSSSRKPIPRARHRFSQSVGYRSMRVDNEEAALVLYQAPDHSSVAPKTPSHIPVLAKSEFITSTPVTPCKNSRFSPTKKPYLTKDSNVPAVVAFDVRTRLESMEAMYQTLASTVNGTSKDHDELRGAVSVYKAKSK